MAAVLPPRNGHTNGHANGAHFTAAPEVNDDPDRIKFAYWVPNVSGGLVISKIPQRTKCVIFPLWAQFSYWPTSSWDYESNVRYAQTAENVGLEYALTQIRFMAGYGAVLLVLTLFRTTNTSLSPSPKPSFTTPRSSM
jgi:hypothetical protein